MNTVQPLTAQQVFDAALFGIRAQGYVPSKHPDTETCMYRSPDGLKCGVGHAIPDDVYDPRLDIDDDGVGTAVLELLNRNRQYTARLRRLFSKLNPDLLVELQVAHDGDLARSASAATWEASMQEIARDYGLHYTPASRPIVEVTE